MSIIRSPRRTLARRELRNLRDFISGEIPPSFLEQFDPDIEDAYLAVLGLVLFVDSSWYKLSANQRIDIRKWLERSSAHCVRELLAWSIALCESPNAARQIRKVTEGNQDTHQDIFERVLNELAPARRRRHGFYCTPSLLAEFAVDRLNRCLIDNFGLTNGVLSTELGNGVSHRNGSEGENRRPIQILEPAVGTGAFLGAFIRVAHRQFQRCMNSDDNRNDWSTHVATELLPRLHACDVQLAPLACAHVQLVASLLRSGFDFGHEAKLSLWQGNPLAFCDVRVAFERTNQPANEPTQFGEFLQTPFSLIVGNPPYGAIHGTATPEMRALMRGQLSGDGGDVSYFQSADGPIAERKTWLYDQYIQFLRWSQYRIDQVGIGAIAFLTNRGFLRHVTMRGLRYQLLKDFDRIEIHDFQGGDNRSSREHRLVAENVFGVRAGIALSVLTKLGVARAETRRIDLWTQRGTAANKIRRLSTETDPPCPSRRLSPTPPLYLFQSISSQRRRQNHLPIRLDQCFELKSSAVVTARDSLVIAFDSAELLERIASLRDRTISDDELRTRWFRRSRSHKFPRGDTRGWKLAEARERLVGDPHWQNHLQRCSYRPLDERAIYWHPEMIDWPRAAVSNLMLDGQNVALIARRQNPDVPGGHFVWITRWPTIDGILRSDNRGNESVFPLIRSRNPTLSNLSPKLIDLVEQSMQTQLDLTSTFSWEAFRQPLPCQARIGAGEVFAYLVALVFSPSHQATQRSSMRHEFISVGITKNEAAFRQLAECGRRLVDTIGNVDPISASDGLSRSTDADETVHRPVWSDGSISIGSNRIAENVADSIWNFRAGSHQVCHKWLADRIGRPLTNQMIREFGARIRTIERLQSIVNEIETVVLSHGGWKGVLA